MDELVSINPAIGEELGRWPLMGLADIEATLAATARSAGQWSEVAVERRMEVIRNTAGLLRERTPQLAALITEEMGKPLAEARSEIGKCALLCDYYAANAAGFLAPELIATDASRSMARFLPLGIVLAIMPWNFPFWQVFRAAVPALAAGNAVLVKPAENVTGCSLAMERLFLEAGFPASLFSVLRVSVPIVSSIISDPRIAAVTFTGSQAAGAIVAAQSAGQVKKTVLELGGSDPFIVLADADVERSAEIAVLSRFGNCGQSCIAAKRFFILSRVYDAWMDAFLHFVSKLKMGDPFMAETTLGPMARRDLRERLEDQVARSVRMGCKVVIGGEQRHGGGWFFEPAVLTGCPPDSAVMEEETFGPVAPVVAVPDERTAIQMANSSLFGLGASVWTEDQERGMQLSRQLHVGGVFINGMTHSDPRLPFGGVRQSGYGRELGRFGLLEFVNVQTIWLA